MRANAVAPSSIRTADNVRAMGDGARYVERETVADAVLRLCAEERVTGHIIALA